jgi:16S rRNA C967 or C1407 C5-methylase (RsmB/RsmF family)
LVDKYVYLSYLIGCAGVLPGQVLLQSLPCVVAAQALDPQPGSRVLDMCAAPGGKTSMLAQMMAGNSSSRLLALDRTAAKAARVRQLVDYWGVGDVVQVLAADATQLYQQAQAVGFQPPDELSPDATVCSSSSSINGSATTISSSEQRSRRRKPDQQDQWQQAELLAAAEPESFDAVLLDAPCSALGLRPRLLMDWRLPQLQALAAYQRALLHAAVHMLKPGGSLVYCTCTINPGEQHGADLTARAQAVAE